MYLEVRISICIKILYWYVVLYIVIFGVLVNGMRMKLLVVGF